MHVAESITLEIVARTSAPAQLQQELMSCCASQPVTVELPKIAAPRFRSVEPIVVAVIQASGSVLAALIAALFSLRGQKHSGRIIIRDGNAAIDVPAQVVGKEDSEEKLNELVEIVQKMRRPQIHIG